MLRVVCTTLFVLFASVMPARAVPVLDFIGGGGTVSYDGQGGALVGTNIPITTLQAFNSAADGTYFVQNGFLNFSTGNLASYRNGVYTFAGAGNITITTGSILSSTTFQPVIPGPIAPALSGSFFGASVGPTGQVQFFLTSTGSDQKAPEILAYFGIPQGTLFQFDGTSNFINIKGSTSTGGAFTATPVSVDIKNTVVPEPGTLALFGSGLLGLAAAARRHVRRRKAD